MAKVKTAKKRTKATTKRTERSQARVATGRSSYSTISHHSSIARLP